MKYEVYGCSELGKRNNQEDAFFYKELPDSNGIFAAVADGMGGHAAGEVASQAAIQVLQNSTKPHLQDRFEEAQTTVSIIGRSDPSKHGLGCTLTAMVLSGSTLSWVHIGDSRLTLIRNGHAIWLTVDQSIAGTMFKIGELSESEYDQGEGHPGLTAYIGMTVDRGTTFLSNVESGSIKALPGDVFVLSSDGVHGALRKNNIAAIVNVTPGKRGTRAKNIAKALNNAAVTAGGKYADNATCVVLIVS